jgi:hypothetical protein
MEKTFRNDSSTVSRTAFRMEHTDQGLFDLDFILTKDSCAFTQNERWLSSV